MFHFVTAYLTFDENDNCGYARDFYVVADTKEAAEEMVEDYLTNEVCDEDEIDEVEHVRMVAALPPLPIQLAEKLYEAR